MATAQEHASAEMTKADEKKTIVLSRRSFLATAAASAAVAATAGSALAGTDKFGRDRDWNEGAARQRFLQLLEAQGLEDQWSSAQRRRLSALLFT